jgi:hypothetical protein
MPVLKSAVALLLAASASSQATVNNALAPAPISCTSQVRTDTCTHAKGRFRSAQKTSKAMFSVEVVLADRQAFQEETNSLKRKSKHATETNPSSPELNKIQFPSPFEHSILFELHAGGLVTKVVICVDLFDTIDVEQLEKEQGRVEPPAKLDKDSVATWAIYVMGYIDGCFSSRVHAMAEAAEDPHKN